MIDMKKYFAPVVIPVIVAVVLGGCSAAGTGGGAGDADSSADPLADIPEVTFAGFDSVSPTSVSTQADGGADAVEQYNTVNDLDNSIVVILTNTVADAIEAHVAAGGDPEQAFTFENIIDREDGAVHKQFFTIRLEDDTNGYVFRGFSDQVYFSADNPDTPQSESSWADAPVELAFGPGFDSARFVLQLLYPDGVPEHQTGVEYSYETQSGKLLSHWVNEEGNDNTQYKSTENDGSITYRNFQDDTTPTVVMEQTSEGIGYVQVTKDDPSVTTYSLLDHDGTDTGNEPSSTLKSDLDSIAGDLDAEFAQNQLNTFLASADLDAPSYDELLPVHQDYTPSWEE